MIRRPPRSTLDRSSAASDVYKRQIDALVAGIYAGDPNKLSVTHAFPKLKALEDNYGSVSYTHLRAHETVLDIVCRLLLAKKKNAHSDHT